MFEFASLQPWPILHSQQEVKLCIPACIGTFRTLQFVCMFGSNAALPTQPGRVRNAAWSSWLQIAAGGTMFL